MLIGGISGSHKTSCYELFQAFAETVREELAKFPENERDEVVILFSAHSLPLKVSIVFWPDCKAILAY